MTPIQRKFSWLCCLPLAAALLLTPVFAALPPIPPSDPSKPSPAQRPGPDQQQLVDKADASCQKGAVGAKERLETTAALEILFPAKFPEHDNNTLYQGCLNAVSSQGCDQLAKDGPPGMRQADCLFLKDFMATAWATLKQNDASACMRLMHWPYDDKQAKEGPKSNAAICGAFASILRDGRAELLVEQGLLPKSDRAAMNNIIFLRGQPELCGKAEPYERAACRAEAALLRALRSGDPAACAASPLCDALASRKAQACAPYLAAATKTFCAGIAKLKAELDAGSAPQKAAKAAGLAQAAKDLEDSTIRKPEDPATAALQAKAAKEMAAAREAALKKSAAEAAMRQRVLEEKVKRAEARREIKEPPRQLRRGEKQQAIPPDVQKRMDAIQAKSKAVQAPAPAGPELPAPLPPTR